MSKNLNHAAEAAEAAEAADAADVHQPDVALARRSMLLRSLGKGSAVLAATSLPMHTLASTTTFVTSDGKGCSISGMESGVNSRNPSVATCTGRKPEHWSSLDRWTAVQLMNKDVKFSALFTDHASTIGRFTLKRFLVDGVTRGGVVLRKTAEWHWCCAWMNAAANNVGGSGVVGFPYTPNQVIDIYNDPLKYKTSRADALSFFKKLEN